MKIGIIGAGALGSLIAFYLSAHADTWLLSRRREQIDAINRNGLRRELNGIEDIRHPHAAADPAAIGPCDIVLVLTKSYATAWAAEQAAHLLKLDTPCQGDKETRRQGATDSVDCLSPCLLVSPSLTLVVTLQNGLGNRELLARRLGETYVGQGVTAQGATLLGLGQVRHAGQGRTVFGAAPDHARMATLVALFNASGLPAELSDDLDALVWGKLVVNAGINALTALLRVPNGALAASADARALMASAIAEAAAVAQARGTMLPYDDPLAHTLAIAQATSANHSSMLQDVLRGSPTEIDAINGAVEREGRRMGVPTPVNSMLAALVRALEATTGARARTP
ncbi:MAG: 2-dehydropantoate 2-reductase [Chloroflexota bacterium]|nr:2-dehydropantoate 2-reductase [Chloroflexota bacterium]